MDDPQFARADDAPFVLRPEQLRWVRHADDYEIAVLAGDPDLPGGHYVMRFRTLVACDVPPHWHPEVEYVTVISGELLIGIGEKFLAEALRPLAPGSLVQIPGRQAHFTRYAPGTVVQLHGTGPFVTKYL